VLLVVLALVVIGVMLLSAETRIRPPRDCLPQHQLVQMEVSLAPTIPVSNISHASPSDIRGGLPSSDSTIRGGIARSDSTNLRVIPSRSTESSLSSSDLPKMDSVASSLDDKDNERTISTVAMDTDALSIFDLLHDDPEFDLLRLNSV